MSLNDFILKLNRIFKTLSLFIDFRTHFMALSQYAKPIPIGLEINLTPGCCREDIKLDLLMIVITC